MQLPTLAPFRQQEWTTILAGTALCTAGLLFRGFFSKAQKLSVIPSPRSTLLPKLSQKDYDEIPYPPDALPGARDIDTPFGMFRAYEWGPETGRKVLLVHGISTPCLALGGVAHNLVDHGCRVLLFDLPGRGYSDTPADLQHDVRLFTSQILLVTSSSPLSWSAASGGFDLVGYSLGGGISVSFTSYFPNLIRSLILIAPAGLIRDYHISRTSRFLYSEGVIPEPILNRLVRKRLSKPLSRKKKQLLRDSKPGATDAVEAELTDDKHQDLLSRSYPDLGIDEAVQHQVAVHEGFIQAFMSSIRYGPIRNEHESWRKVGSTFTQRNSGSSAKERVLIVLGEKDPIIILNEIKQDAAEVLQNNVEFKILPTGHDVPIVKCKEVADIIWTHLNDSL